MSERVQEEDSSSLSPVEAAAAVKTTAGKAVAPDRMTRN